MNTIAVMGLWCYGLVDDKSRWDKEV